MTRSISFVKVEADDVVGKQFRSAARQLERLIAKAAPSQINEGIARFGKSPTESVTDCRELWQEIVEKALDNVVSDMLEAAAS